MALTSVGQVSSFASCGKLLKANPPSGLRILVRILPFYPRFTTLHTQESLPITFDTPMFWGSEDLEQLKGTAVLGLSVSHMAIAAS
jgi:hypothetical protein